MEEKLVLYIEIKQLKERDLNPSQIARQLKISRPTVYEYLSMSYEEAQAWVMGLNQRVKKLDAYEEWLVAWLKNTPISMPLRLRIGFSNVFQKSKWVIVR